MLSFLLNLCLYLVSLVFTILLFYVTAQMSDLI